MIEMRFVMMNLVHVVQIVVLMMMTIVTYVFSYVDQDLFVVQNIYHNVYNEMVVHVYEYFVYVVVNLMRSKNFDYKICKHKVVLVNRKKNK